MKYCPQCEKEYEAGSFCPVCGSGLVEKSKAPQNGGVCPFCNAPLMPNAGFCPSCGNQVSQAYAYVPPTPVAQPKPMNPIVKKALDALKNVFVNPKEVFEKALQERSMVFGLIPSAILLVASIIFWLCIVASLHISYGASKLYGIGILCAILFTLAFVFFPSVTGLVASKISGRANTFGGVFNASAWNTVLVAAFILLSGFLSLFSVKLMTFTLFIGLGLKLFLSVSLIDYIAGNSLNSAKQLWGTFGVAFAMKFVFCLLLGLLCQSQAEYVLNRILGSIFEFMW